MVEIIREKDIMRRWSRKKRAQGMTIALVPTMGFLHEGHISLIREAKKHCQLIVVSIYVNPGQFAPSEDLSTYPRNFDGDLAKLNSIPGGVHVVFNPHDLYDYGDSISKEYTDEGVSSSCLRSGHETWIRVEALEKGMCGSSRPIFFRGVATVVAKLFNIVEPDLAVFGKKDYQQWRLICRMVRDLDFSVNVIGSEIVRDEDGLAMSSRNVHLSPEQRKKVLSYLTSVLSSND